MAGIDQIEARKFCADEERTMTAMVRGPIDLTKDLVSTALDHKYDLTKTRIFISGTQAVVRLLLMQKAIDAQAGLRTAGFVSGYRGSPLGGLDLNLNRAKAQLESNDIHFQPGLNEDLAATAIWGSQQAQMRGEGRTDGVFGLWYGKGPGVDRCGDVFKHANLSGTARYGGVLALMGDDHTAESSTTAHQSEYAFVDAMIPVFSPAGVQEIIDYGLLGFAMSRFTGTWTGLKCLKDTIESTASIDVSLQGRTPVLPDGFFMPPGGLNIRPHDDILDQEIRLHHDKHEAVLAWLRANKINRLICSGGPNPRIGVICAGKSYLDVRQAMDCLGIDEVRANVLGLRIFKLGCTYPLEPQGLKAFADGLELIIVVEEKRGLIESQLREVLYDSPRRPQVIGKKDETGNWLFRASGSIDGNEIAIVIGERLQKAAQNPDFGLRLNKLEKIQARLTEMEEAAARHPYFCSGCPHNRSTIVPEGMRAYAGIGCHFMALNMDRATDGYTHMGGEGANWVGEAAFSTRKHIVQNLGDGTYNHSGLLALRFAIAAKVNITYKILFNDAVAMTGGQALEGDLTVDKIARQVVAEGVQRVLVVTDDPLKYPSHIEWPQGLDILHREQLEAAQRELSMVKGVSVLIYDQTCATEKRRRRKRAGLDSPEKRVFINTMVCEGCGDCGVKSNCVSIQPVETEFGRKRRIDQTSCNKDFSCIDGFCPALVTVHGAKLKEPKLMPLRNLPALPEPQLPELAEKPFSILITGIGGTGVVTIGAVLGMAAHLEGKGCGLIDMAGLAQKGGAVYCHVKIAQAPQAIHAIRITAGEADLVLGCDLIVSGSKKVLASIAKNETAVVVNTAESFPGEFTHDADYTLPSAELKRSIGQAAGFKAEYLDATTLCGSLLGSTLYTNIFLLGFAWQKGFVPLGREAIRRAVELNGQSVELNIKAFELGRIQAAMPETLAPLLHKSTSPPLNAKCLDEIIAGFAAYLTAYQNEAYARRFEVFVRRVQAIEASLVPGRTLLSESVARSYFKLLAIKDEYEVARLFADRRFADEVRANFDGALKLEYHLAPPFLGRRNSSGEAVKQSFGPWFLWLFKILARFKSLRGTMFDVFSWSQARKDELRLIKEYESLIEKIMPKLGVENYGLAIDLAQTPQKIRGFGHVRQKAIVIARAAQQSLLDRYFNMPEAIKVAAE